MDRLTFCYIYVIFLQEVTDSSFSDVMNDALEQAYYQKRTGVWVSPGAYLAIANGQLEALECVRSRYGGIDLVLKRDAPALAGDGQDSTYPDMERDTIYSIGEGMLRNTCDTQMNRNMMVKERME